MYKTGQVVTVLTGSLRGLRGLVREVSEDGAAYRVVVYWPTRRRQSVWLYHHEVSTAA